VSLSSLIRNPSPVLKRLQADFPRPRLTGKPTLVAPNTGERATTVGTAYDYLLRFHLMREIPFATSYPWIAERACNKMADSEGFMFPMGDSYESPEDLWSPMGWAVYHAKRAVTRLVAGEKLTTRLAALCLHLAECDDFERTGRISEAIYHPSVRDFADLRRIIAATDLTLFKATRTCLLNPEFGEGTRLIQGADADLLLDDFLIDVKTTNDFSLRSLDWHQLIGYVALNQNFPIGGGTAPVAINRIGIYFARYNHLETWPLSDVVDAGKLTAFATWLMDYLIEQDAIRVAQAQELEQELAEYRDTEKASRERHQRKAKRVKKKAPKKSHKK
jgi:hypothetical protein